MFAILHNCDAFHRLITSNRRKVNDWCIEIFMTCFEGKSFCDQLRSAPDCRMMRRQKGLNGNQTQKIRTELIQCLYRFDLDFFDEQNRVWLKIEHTVGSNQAFETSNSFLKLTVQIDVACEVPTYKHKPKLWLLCCPGRILWRSWCIGKSGRKSGECFKLWLIVIVQAPQEVNETSLVIHKSWSSYRCQKKRNQHSV